MSLEGATQVKLGFPSNPTDMANWSSHLFTLWLWKHRKARLWEVRRLTSQPLTKVKAVVIFPGFL